MKQVIRITLDPLCSLGYIEYQEPSEHDGYRNVLRNPDGRVEEFGRDDKFDHACAKIMVWFDVNEIVALEIISIDDPESIAIARDYARDNDLAFPGDVRTAAARSTAA
jgi:hypothetical protein